MDERDGTHDAVATNQGGYNCAGEPQAAEQSEMLPLDKPDLADENALNRIVWHSVRGVDAAYPAEFAGAHGKGLRKLGLRLDTTARDDDDD